MKKKLNVALIFYYENISEKDNRLFFLQWKKIQKLIESFANEELNFYPVIFNQGPPGILSTPIPKNFLFWDISFEKKFPYFLLKKCQKFLLIPKDVIPSKRDFFYILNTNYPFLLVKPMAKSHLKQIILDLKPIYYGIISINRDAFLQLKNQHFALTTQKPKKMVKKNYQNYNLLDRIFLTVWFSQIPLKIRQGKSISSTDIEFWQSWRLIYQCAKQFRKKHPLPTFSLKSLHFRLVATQLSFLLGFLFSPVEFFWIYILVGFAIAYDYFLPKNIKDLFLRIFFLPFV